MSLCCPFLSLLSLLSVLSLCPFVPVVSFISLLSLCPCCPFCFFCPFCTFCPFCLGCPGCPSGPSGPFGPFFLSLLSLFVPFVCFCLWSRHCFERMSFPNHRAWNCCTQPFPTYVRHFTSSLFLATSSPIVATVCENGPCLALWNFALQPTDTSSVCRSATNLLRKTAVVRTCTPSQTRTCVEVRTHHTTRPVVCYTTDAVCNECVKGQGRRFRHEQRDLDRRQLPVPCYWVAHVVGPDAWWNPSR